MVAAAEVVVENILIEMIMDIMEIMIIVEMIHNYKLSNKIILKYL